MYTYISEYLILFINKMIIHILNFKDSVEKLSTCIIIIVIDALIVFTAHHTYSF